MPSGSDSVDTETAPPGTTIAKVCSTCAAGWKAASPAWLASMLQFPGASEVNWPAVVTVHTLGVAEVKLTRSVELADATKIGDVPKFCAPGLLKVMLWVPIGVTEFEGPEGPPGPALLVAVTVNV